MESEATAHSNLIFQSSQGLKHHHQLKHDETCLKKPAAAVCDLCHKSFGSKRTLERHIRRMHHPVSGVGTDAVTYPVTDVGTKRYLCSVCGLSFGSNPGLNLHRHLKHGDTCLDNSTAAVCALCHKSFSSKRKLQHHISKKHRNTMDVAAVAEKRRRIKCSGRPMIFMDARVA